MGKKSRAKKEKREWRKARPDEVFHYGPLQIARYGRFIQFKNTATPEQHSEFLKKVAEVHKSVVPELSKEVATLQSFIQKYDPVQIMHRAAYVLLPLFLKYHSESEFASEESYALPTVEYLQYLISRTPRNSDGNEIKESEWEELWASARKCLTLTQNYLFTRQTTSNPPTEIDQLRFAVDSRRLMIRVRRYPVYFADHIRDSLLPYGPAIRQAYGIDVDQLVRGLEEINAYQKSGVLGRYHAFRESNEALMHKLLDLGYSLTPGEMERDADKIKAALDSPEVVALNRDVQEKGRLTLTPAIFDITDITSLPPNLLSLLSVRAGESVLTTLTGPNHDDLSPLSTSPLHYKPFLENDGRFYYFYHSGFEDRIAEIIEDDLFRRFPDRASSMRRTRDDHLESLATDLMVTLVKPEVEHRNLFYPDPDQPGGITELDALLATDDILFLIEIKAGVFSAAANRGAPDSLFDELSDTIGTGQRQSERAQRYMMSAEEVPFFDSTGKQEVCRLRYLDFRRVFRVVITREDLGWVGARIAILSMLDPKMTGPFPWHVSLDDLRVVAELFSDSELRFVHFLEQRLAASSETALSQHDEIEHIGLYNKINLYHDLPVRGMNQVSFDASFMRDIDVYFSEKYQGHSPELPRQELPTRLAGLMHALRESHQHGRFAAGSIILSMDEGGRNDVERALEHLDAGRDAGKQRSLRMPFRNASYGLTISYAEGAHWDEELVRSAAQMEQSRCAHWVAIQLERSPPYAIRGIEQIVPGRFAEAQLARARAYVEGQVMKSVKARSVSRNDPCPCGSGRKYKKCHGG